MLINTLCVFGTRPEAIKMAPLVKKLNSNVLFHNKVCITGQHQQMLTPILEVFNIHPDYDLQVMTPNQDLSELTAKILEGLRNVFKQYIPDLIIIHGDTTTNLAAALSAFYHRIPIAHVEAGLRTGNLSLPWPEEANRKLSDALSNFHFAPTEQAKINLINEGVSLKSIHVTGNTVIDALYDMLDKIENQPELVLSLQQKFSFLNPSRKMMLVTGHRRESFGEGFERICQALAIVAADFPDVDIVYPVHLNPNVQEPVNRLLGQIKNIYLIPPVEYLQFVYLMKSAYLILTDSGGIQEEAPALGKPVLVMRETTERPEALEAGTVKLVGTEVHLIVEHVRELLTDAVLYRRMSLAQNPYGDGNASLRIMQFISEQFRQEIDVRSVFKETQEVY